VLRGFIQFEALYNAVAEVMNNSRNDIWMSSDLKATIEAIMFSLTGLL
jgi:hypothetical protein